MAAAFVLVGLVLTLFGIGLFSVRAAVLVSGLVTLAAGVAAIPTDGGDRR